MTQAIDLLLAAAPHIATAATLLAALLAAAHAVLYRRDVRTSIAWVGLIVLVPLLGALLYVILGVNRIQRRARSLRGTPGERPATGAAARAPAAEVAAAAGAAHLAALVRVGDRVIHRPLTGGNRVALLDGGDAAYAAMLEAIEAATRSVSLTSYIFDCDRAGRRFAEALGRAARRGVAVRVLVDGVGVRYSRPRITRLLAHERVPHALFLPPIVPWRFRYMNLRNHRKILVVDGRVAFTGGMNLREGYQAGLSPPPLRPIRDVQARIDGPVVAQVQQAFAEDWVFTTGETLAGEAWFPRLDERGPVFARGIPDGPDEHLDELRLTLLGALSAARERVAVITPYFVPDATLITALNVAALRGVEVELLLPSRGNLALVRWASAALLWQVLERGCRVWLSPPPFDHTKLMVVDGAWTLLGSGNWDTRSLRLNFELNVECYDRALAAQALAIFEARRRGARLLSLEQVDGRSLPVRLRDGMARLLSPYL